MHPFSALTLGIFVAGYTTARWDLVTRLYELAIFAWDYGVVVSRPVPPAASHPALRTRAPFRSHRRNLADLTRASPHLSCAPRTVSSSSRPSSSVSFSLWHVWQQESQTWYDRPPFSRCVDRPSSDPRRPLANSFPSILDRQGRAYPRASS